MISGSQFGALFSSPEGGGFSVNTVTGESPKSGYMVSKAGTERSLPSTMIHPHDLHQYAQDYSGRLSEPHHYFGAWHDVERGAVDLDTSVNMPSGGPVEKAAAHVAMIRHGQRALYNVDTGGVESNAYYGQSPEQAHATIKTQYKESARGHR